MQDAGRYPVQPVGVEGYDFVDLDLANAFYRAKMAVGALWANDNGRLLGWSILSDKRWGSVLLLFV